MADYQKKPTPYEELLKRQLDRIGESSKEVPIYTPEGNTEFAVITRLEQEIGTLEAMLPKNLKKTYTAKLPKIVKAFKAEKKAEGFQTAYKRHYSFLLSKLALLAEVINMAGMGLELEEEGEV